MPYQEYPALHQETQHFPFVRFFGSMLAHRFDYLSPATPFRLIPTYHCLAARRQSAIIITLE